MNGISGNRYREILRYVIALEEAEDFSNAVIELLRYVIPYDATLYIRLDRRGLLLDTYALTPGVETGAQFYDKAFIMKDPVFDFGNRASGLQRREPVLGDLNEPDKEGETDYHTDLRKMDICDYLSFPISETGEGIRLYRIGTSPRFTEEDLAVCEVLSSALKRMMPRHREYESRDSENYLWSVTHKMLPFGMLLYDESFHLLRYNTLALSRVSEITGEQNFRDMVDSFTELVRRQAEEMLRTKEEISHSTVEDRYIFEVSTRTDIDANGRFARYYNVILYATDWFRDYLTDSVEVVLAQYGLTAREVQVASAVVQGMSNTEIADAMCISTNTVKEHFKNIFRKMQVSSRGEMLIKIFIKHGTERIS